MNSNEEKKKRPPRPKIPVAQIMAWLVENHADLVKQAEVDRNWVWLYADLRGKENDAVRESLLEFGFALKNPKKGGHTLPSGKVAYWAHHGEKPMPFRKGKGGSGKGSERNSQREQVGHGQGESLDDAISQALAEIGIV